MKRLVGYSMIASLALLGASIVPAGAATKAQVQARAISLSNLPAGWSIDQSTSSGGATSGCLKNLKMTGKHDTKVTVEFKDGAQAEAPNLKEDVETGPSAADTYQRFTDTLNACKAISFSDQGQNYSGTVAVTPFPKVGKQSAAYSVVVPVQGVDIEVDVVAFEVKKYIGDVIYEDIGTPNLGQVEGFVNGAVNKIEGKPTGPSTAT